MPVLRWDILKKNASWGVLGCFPVSWGVLGCPGVLRLTGGSITSVGEERANLSAVVYL